MKLTAAFLVLTPATEGRRPHIRAGKSFLVQRISERFSNATSLRSIAGPSYTYGKYGSSKCPCVGIDNLEGTTEMHYGNQIFSYPADVGGRCNAWENGVHPDCKGFEAPGWCHQHWCYVDPCNCELDVPAKPSVYMRTGKIQGKPVHYSYRTCGSTDSWSDGDIKENAHDADNAALCSEKIDEKHWGKSQCRCIGIDGQKGVTVMRQNGKKFSYPADAGARCDTWEGDHHPDCKGEYTPPWCHEAWCYVDPCSCDLEMPSKPSAFLPDATYQGRPVHFSHATCGAADSWSSVEAKVHAAENKVMCAALGAARAASANFAHACVVTVVLHLV